MYSRHMLVVDGSLHISMSSLPVMAKDGRLKDRKVKSPMKCFLMSFWVVFIVFLIVFFFVLTTN